MSYVVLARKWRPQTFDDLVGQEHVARTLANSIALGRVAHAFLFTGVRGVGKTTSARILAKALNCESGPTAKPCLACSACIDIGAGSALDVQEIDAATNTGVEDIRRLQETLSYRPARDRFKIFVVDEVHMLSNNAWNAFLKTLEEPPPHVKFIFATTEASKVPVTVLSRCQRYDFKLIAASTIAARLRFVLEKEGVRFEDGAVQILAREAAGSMRDAMSLLDQVIANVGHDALDADAVAAALGVAPTVVLQKLAGHVLDGDAASALAVVGQLADSGYDLAHVSRDFLALLRDLVVARVAPDTRALLDVPDAELADLRGLASKHGPDDLVRLHQAFARSVDEVLRSPAPRGSLEMALVRLARRPALVPVDELLRRLGELEARLEGGGARPLQATSAARPPQAPSPAPAARPNAAMQASRPAGANDPPPWAAPPPARLADASARPRAPSSAAPGPSSEPSEEPDPAPSPPASNAAPSASAGAPAASTHTSGRALQDAPRGADVPAARFVDDPAPSRVPAARGDAAHEGARAPIPDRSDARWLRYAEVIEDVRVESGRLASLLERGSLVDLSAAGVVLAVEPRSFEAQQLGVPATRAALGAAIVRSLGVGATLAIVDLAEGVEPVTLAQMVAEATRARQAELERSVREHPLVVEAIRVLGAEIRDLRVPLRASTAPIDATSAVRRKGSKGEAS
jgi:DNA polymerase-3 subunit gamma/tau